MKKIKLLFKRFIFNCIFYMFKKHIKSMNISPIIDFPLMIDMELNKEKWFQNYLKGQSIEYQLEQFVKLLLCRHKILLSSAIRRSKREISDEVYERYQRFIDYCETKQDLMYYFPEHFKKS